MKARNAVDNLKDAYKDGVTLVGWRDVQSYLQTQSFTVTYKTAQLLDTVARRQLTEEGIQIQDPSGENSYTRTGIATQEEVEKSRQWQIRYVRTRVTNLAVKLNLDALNPEASVTAIANAALLQRSVEFIEALRSYEELLTD